MAQLGDLVLAGMNKEQVERHLRPFLTPAKPVVIQPKVATSGNLPVAKASPGVKKQVVVAPKPDPVAKATVIQKPVVVVQQPVAAQAVVQLAEQSAVAEIPVETIIQIEENLPKLENDAV